jgi:hypothetical protein
MLHFLYESRISGAKKPFMLPADSVCSPFEFAPHVPAAPRPIQDYGRRKMPTQNAQTLENSETVIEFRRARKIA